MTSMCLCLLGGNLVSRQVLSGKVCGEYYWTLRLPNATGGQTFREIRKKRKKQRKTKETSLQKKAPFCQKKATQFWSVHKLSRRERSRVMGICDKKAVRS